MIDFLFLMLALFATLAISKAALYDAEIDLVQLKPQPNARPLHSSDLHQINLSIAADGHFKWMTEFQEYPMENVKTVQEELSRQYQIGALPQDKSKTEIHLHIDKKAPWEPIANLIFGIKEVGFTAHPIYDSL